MFAWTSDAAADQFESYVSFFFAHLLPQDRFHLNPPLLGDFGRGLELFEPLKGGLDQVVGVVGAEGFGQNILYPCNLHHGPDRRAGDNPRSF